MAKKVIRGLAAGLSELGRGIKEKEAKAEETRRFEEQSAREERRLQIAEQDAANRQEAAELANTMKQVQFKNQQMNAAIQRSQYEAGALGRAITNFGSAGEVYTHDKIRSAEEAKRTGNPDAVVYKVSMYDKDPVSGKIRTGDDGKFVEIPFPVGQDEVVLESMDERTRWATGHSNPEHMLGIAMSGMQAEDLHKAAVRRSGELAEAAATTPQGVAGLDKTRAQTGKLKAETEVLKRGVGAKPPRKSSYTNLDGKEVDLGTEESQTARKEFEKMAKNITSLSSVGEAKRINETKNDPKIRADFALDIQATLVDPSVAKTAKDKWLKKGLNAEYYDQVVAQAELDKETWVQAEKARTPNLAQKAINKILGTGFGTGK